MSSLILNDDRKQIIQEIAQTYGTPVYVYFADEINERIEKVKSIFEGINILPTFACKANNNPHIVEHFSRNGFGTDIVSIGEYYVSKRAGVDDQKIVWNGNGKSRHEIEVLSNCVGYVNIDSVEEYERWKEYETDATFFLRVNPDVDPMTHHHISTGLKKNKFGIPVEEIDKILNDKNGPKISGFHVHIGSQIVDVEPFDEALSSVANLSRRYGFSKINIGGGWGIKYEDKELNLEEYKRKIIPHLEGFELILFELGRYLIAPAGLLVATVQYVKRTSHKTFVVVDAGMNTLIRPAMYDAYHNMIVLTPTEGIAKADVVGPLCESGDLLARDREIQIPKVGSHVVFENVGAYGYSMSSNYNSYPRPAEVLVSENGSKITLIRRRETIDDLFRTIV
ncbi:MAG TPA: diaminopimelate decarboxylase [Fervidobacterium sp.]|nr:diaminopimelate decarboxylase [Fervidobacterium sp.]